MKRHILILFILLSLLSTKAQLVNIDSLILVAKRLPNDTNKLHALSLISENADDGVWQRYNNELGKCAVIVQNSGDPKIKLVAKRYLAASLNNTGFDHFDSGNSRLGLYYFQKSLGIQKEIKDSIGISQSLNNIAAVYDSQGDILKALQYYFESLAIRELTNDLNGIAQTLNNIAVLYSNQNDIVSSIKYHKKCLAIKEKLNNTAGIALSYNNIGTNYSREIDEKAALHQYIPEELFKMTFDYFNKSYHLNEKLQNDDGLALSSLNIGMFYLTKAMVYEGNNVTAVDTFLRKAEYYVVKCLKLYEKHEKIEMMSNALQSLAKIDLRRGDIASAEKNALKALSIGKMLGYPLLKENAAEILKKVYQTKGDYKTALAMSDLYYSIKDSLVNENIKKETVSKQFIYENEKKDVLIKANQEKIAYTFRTKEKEQRTILIFVIIGALLILFFGLFIFNRFKVTQRQKQLIERKEEETQYQKNIIEEKQKEILDSIHYAKRIQNTLLAHSDFLNENLPDNFILFKPKDIVSGDFYWATKKDELFYLAVCDSTGHGVPGAFMSLLNIGFLSEAINEKGIVKPNEVLDYARTRLINSMAKEGQQDGFDGVLMCIDQNTMKITYSAAHNSPVVLSKGELRILASDKMPVGKGIKDSPFQLFTLELEKSEILYLYTDGYADQFGGKKGKKFKYKQLNEMLAEISSKDLSEQKLLLEERFDDWKGNLEQVDDVLIVGIRI